MAAEMVKMSDERTSEGSSGEAKDFKVVKEMNLLCTDLTKRVKERSGNIVVVESAKLLRELNDVDLAKGRTMMTAISKTQIKVLKKISFVVQMGAASDRLRCCVVLVSLHVPFMNPSQRMVMLWFMIHS
ncbi:hypothetical protein Tco_1369960 [Tanacetum coccineum]